MAKGAHRKKKHRDQSPPGTQLNMTFFFADPSISRISPGYLSDLSGKIRGEFSSRFRICVLQKEPSPPGEPSGKTEYIGEDRLKDKEVYARFDEGYAVIFRPGSLVRQINPNEFFQLSLPVKSGQKVYHEILFRGKSGSVKGGLILPAGVLQYLFSLSVPDEPLDTEIIAKVLGKLDFRKEEAVIHQDSPFEESRPMGSRLKERVKLTLTWNTTLPVREARVPALRNLFFIREHPLFRTAFVITALAIFIILPILSLDAGLSGDDEKHYQQAIKVYRYFTEDDPSALDDPQYKLNYYGQSFDFFTYLIIRLLHLEDHPYEARHVMVAIAGAAAILVTGLVVRLFGGYGAGWLALLLMFLSPRFLGHAYNNSMDVPFALGYIFTIYHTILFLRKLPRISTRSAIWIAVGIGWTNGIRIGGLILIPYLFMFAGLYLLLHKWPWKFFSAGWWRFAFRGLLTLILISGAGYILSLLTWPYALQDIINHPIQSFKVMSNIQVSLRVLYDGVLQWSDRLPWNYIPKNILLTVPVLILLGWLASSFTWYFHRKERQGFWYFLLWFSVLFPVVFIIIRESNVYGGWRHMMFVYPPMLALSAMAISTFFQLSRNRWVTLALVLLVAAGMFHPLRHIIRNHPDTYIYFNEWAGGINHAYGTYETDYYMNSLRPASDYFISHILPEKAGDAGQPLRVVSNGDIGYYFRDHLDRVAPFYSRYYDRGKYDWDYAILYCNYIHPFQLNHGLWPPKNTIHEIRVDDVPVAAIVERKNKDDYKGSQLLSEGMQEEDPRKLNQAVHFLESAIEYDPNNEAAYLELINAYAVFFRFDEARATADRLLEIYPDYDKALNAKGYTYLLESEVRRDGSLIDEAIRIINEAIKSNYKFYSGYYNLGLCYGLKNDKDNAIYYFKQAIRYNGRFREAYEKLAEVYEYYGDTEMANSVRSQLRNLR
jgi:tetratricopeptide (TPR) repeat protein